MRIERPVWRRFHERFSSRAVDWVRQGGHAVVQKTPRDLTFVLPEGEDGKLTEYALWSLLAVLQYQARRATEGPFKGLRVARVQPHSIQAVDDWLERDSVHPGPSRVLKLDCLDCGACCVDSDVQLGDDDLEVFRAGGREDLTTSRYIKRSRDGKVRLRFLKSDGGRCQHLQKDLKCKIYELRPYNCSVFPVGSEACLAARESTLSLRD